MAAITSVDGTSVRIRWETDAWAGPDRRLSIIVDRAGDHPRTLRGWDDVDMPALVIAIDHEAALNRPVTYTLLVDGEPVDEVSVTVDATMPLITDPVRGLSWPLLIQSWDDQLHERAGQLVTIANSPAHFVVDGPEMDPSARVVLIHPRDGDSAAGLVNLLKQSSVLLIRPSCPQLPASYLSVRSRTRRRFSTIPDSAWVDELDVVQVGQPHPWIIAHGETLADLAAAVPGTLADIAARWQLDLAQIAWDPLQ